tara:strand:+ start:243 stop:419 length:177 start_codon:yes stop_codon:yes gene_type:complete
MQVAQVEAVQVQVTQDSLFHQKETMVVQDKVAVVELVQLVATHQEHPWVQVVQVLLLQ